MHLGRAEVTTQGMIQSGLTLVPYYFWDSFKGVAKVTKPNFVRDARSIVLALAETCLPSDQILWDALGSE